MTQIRVLENHLPPASAIALHHPEYQGQPVVLNSHGTMPPQQYFTTLPPLQSVSHQRPHPFQATGTFHLIHSHASGASVTSTPPPSP